MGRASKGIHFIFRNQIIIALRLIKIDFEYNNIDSNNNSSITGAQYTFKLAGDRFDFQRVVLPPTGDNENLPRSGNNGGTSEIDFFE